MVKTTVKTGISLGASQRDTWAFEQVAEGCDLQKMSQAGAFSRRSFGISKSEPSVLMSISCKALCAAQKIFLNRSSTEQVS